MEARSRLVFERMAVPLQGRTFRRKSRLQIDRKAFGLRLAEFVGLRLSSKQLYFST